MKNFVFMIVLACSSLIFAQTASTSPFQLESGNFYFNSSLEGFTLNQNSGERSVSIEVTFPKPFDKKPKVILSVFMLDADTKTQTRYKIEPYSVSRDGFMIKATTWGDTKINGIGGSWVAHTEN